jgi:hydroxymethylbilane synthase
VRTLRIGTRGSALARWQAEHVRDLLEAHQCRSKIEIITTSGDRGQRTPTAGVTGKALFTKEIEDALLAGDIDLAVHSLKDMSIVMPEGLVLGAVPMREDPRDAVVTRNGNDFDALVAGSRIGTASVRRTSAVKALRPDLEVVTIRGNVPTRLQRMTDGDVDAVILAMAGLRRLGLDSGARPIDPARLVPAPGQGALGIQARADDAEVLRAVRNIDDVDTHTAVRAERAALQGLESGCAVPIGAHCRRGELMVAVYAVDGSRTLRATVPVDAAAPERGGHAAATDLAQQGAGELIEAALDAAVSRELG